MTIAQINTFLIIAKYKSYTKASNELQISVSALSRQISSMEEELGVKLFKRSSKNVELTASGQFFYEKAVKLFHEYESTVENTRKIEQGFVGSLSVAVLDDMTLKGPVQDGFHKFHKAYPNVSLQLERSSFQTIADGIASGKYDCAFSLFFTLNQFNFLKYKNISKTDEGILISKKNPLSRKKWFDPYEFRNQTFILIKSPEKSYLNQGPQEFFRKYHISPSVIYASDADTATLMVEAGLGIAFSNTQAIGVLNPGMKFLVLKDQPAVTNGPTFVLAWNEENTNPLLPAWIQFF